jgi:6-phosphofructokinase 2
MILTLTMNPAVDKSSRVDNVVPERKLRCDTPRFEPGGGGINASRAIRRLGGESVALYLSGGPTGRMLTGLLEAEGVDVLAVPTGGWTRENLIVLEQSTGLQYRFGMPGPLLQETEWSKCLARVSEIDPRPDYIVASGSLPPGVPEDFYARLARVARDTGARMIVDASGKPLWHALREGVFLAKPNLREVSELPGHGVSDEAAPEDLAQRIVKDRQSEVAVISLGAAGALMATEEGCEHLAAPVVPIESKVGAGDSMVAGIVLGLTRGLSLREAVRFGVAAGAAAVMTPGSELCRREDAERLYDQMTSGTTG